jgi:hypothetical protein
MTAVEIPDLDICGIAAQECIKIARIAMVSNSLARRATRGAWTDPELCHLRSTAASLVAEAST